MYNKNVQNIHYIF